MNLTERPLLSWPSPVEPLPLPKPVINPDAALPFVHAMDHVPLLSPRNLYRPLQRPSLFGNVIEFDTTIIAFVYGVTLAESINTAFSGLWQKYGGDPAELPNHSPRKFRNAPLLGPEVMV